jgi:hypothetical protein
LCCQKDYVNENFNDTIGNRFVAQCLNHYATACPELIAVHSQIKNTFFTKTPCVQQFRIPPTSEEMAQQKTGEMK